MNMSKRPVVAHSVNPRRFTAHDFIMNVGEGGGRYGKLLNFRMQRSVKDQSVITWSLRENLSGAAGKKYEIQGRGCINGFSKVSG
jgi:hypothetical protein